MRPEIRNTVLTAGEAVSLDGNGDLEKIEACLALIFQGGRDPIDVVRDIWVAAFRENLSPLKPPALVDKLVDRLPEEMQRNLQAFIGRGGVTPLVKVREEARSQVEREMMEASAAGKQAEPEKPKVKRASRSERIHTRREKARKRRALIK